MKKAVLSNRIYLSTDFFLKRDIDEKLTYTIPPRHRNEPPLVIKTMSTIKEDLISIPSGREDLIPEDYEIVDKRVLVPCEFPEFKYELRPTQKEIYDKLNNSGVINATVSWGKTFCAIALATKLKQKTLVVTHNTTLRDQWVKEVKKTLGITPGVIGSGKFNMSGPISIGNTQTLYRNVPQIARSFGTLIVDEMHHVPATTFSKIVDSSHARYKIGLSGTIQRKDGKHVLFPDYFGFDLYQPPKENYMEPRVHIIKSNIRFPESARMPWALKINELTQNLEYKEFISVLASVYAKKGHKVLVVSDRVQFLKSCALLIGDSAASVTGDTPLEERAELDKLMREKDVLFGTQAIFSEGMSINALSCLILATPINNEPLLTQLIGRIVRVHPNKLSPVIVDVHLKGNIAQTQARNRLAHYIKEGYRVEKF